MDAPFKSVIAAMIVFKCVTSPANAESEGMKAAQSPIAVEYRHCLTGAANYAFYTKKAAPKVALEVADAACMADGQKVADAYGPRFAGQIRAIYLSAIAEKLGLPTVAREFDKAVRAQ